MSPGAMKFPSGIVASCNNTTYGANMEGYYRVYGSKGWLEVDSAFVYEGRWLYADCASGKPDELNPARDPSHFQAEADHFSHCAQNGLEPQSPGAERFACKVTCATSRRFTALAGIAI